MSQETTSEKFFEEKYRQTIDPWNFEHSAYEQNRYNTILKALGGRRYKRGFEPGCSIGVLTRCLSRHCDHLDAIDISPTAAGRASQRCRRLENVAIRCGSLPHSIPDGVFDLIVFSEIGYYFHEKALQEALEILTTRLVPSGTLIAAHWLGKSADHLLSGDRVHETIRQNTGLFLEYEQRAPLFRLDRMVRR